MRSLLAISLILVCFVDKSYGTFAEFMNNLPTEVANAFGSAWASISDAIKKPVRIKRLGHGGKQKSSTTTTKKTPTTVKGSEPSGYLQERKEKGTTSSSTGMKVTLPVLPTPRFKTLDEWRNMQIAHYIFQRKKVKPSQSKYNISTDPTTNTKITENLVKEIPET